MKRASRRPVLMVAGVAALAGLGAGLWMFRSATIPMPTQPANQGAPAALATPRRTVAIGDVIAPLQRPDLDGAPVDLAGFRGRPLLVNVWASWCAPCIEEMPELSRFANAQGEHGIQVLGLALDTPDNIRAFLQQVPVNYPIMHDLPGPTDASVALGNDKGLLPYSVLIDADGRLLKQKLGPFEPGELDAWATP